jgi:hypothetical protein
MDVKHQMLAVNCVNGVGSVVCFCRTFSQLIMFNVTLILQSIGIKTPINAVL